MRLEDTPVYRFRANRSLLQSALFLSIIFISASSTATKKRYYALVGFVGRTYPGVSEPCESCQIFVIRTTSGARATFVGVDVAGHIPLLDNWITHT
jgi:hypothetical protein